MSQVPLAPPPQTGQPIDSWLYLLWRRLTATGQMLWSSIVPGSSADVAAVVTDETGSPGSLVFSGNPTLDGVEINGLFYQGDTTEPAGFSPFLGGMFSTDNFAGTNLIVRKCTSNAAGNTASASFLRSRGTAASPTTVISGDSVGGFIGGAYDGTNYKAITFINFGTEGTVSSGVVPGNMQVLTANASGTLTEQLAITSTGVITLGGARGSPALKVTPVASQARWIEVTGATSSTNPTIGVSGGSLGITASVAITGVVSTSGYTVATLPAGTVGDRAYVTDALAPAYGVAVAGGGAVTIPVFYDGAAWICA